MDDTLILESTFLIDLEREQRRGTAGIAMEFLALHRHHRFAITPTIAGELAAGTSMTARPGWEEFLRSFRWLPITPDVAWRFGRTFQFLRVNGMSVGVNDLWIAATALSHDVPVVTANVRDFARIPGLEVIGYG